MMKKLTSTLLGLALLAVVTDLGAQDEDPGLERDGDPGFRIVVNAANPITEMEAKDVSRIFTKRSVRWDQWEVDGNKQRAVPIDQPHDSPVREAFSEAVHDKSPSAIVSYWNRMIFSGTETPPDQVATDREVMEFVRANSGAIGYVSSDAELAEGVKELKLAAGG